MPKRFRLSEGLSGARHCASPLERDGFMVLDEGVFAVHVGLWIAWVVVGKPALQIAVRGGSGRVRVHVVTEREVTFYVWTADFERVELMCPQAFRGVLSEVASPWDAKLALGLIPELDHGGRRLLEKLKVSGDQEHVDDRLCEDASNRGTADVMHGDRVWAQRLENLFGLTQEVARP